MAQPVIGANDTVNSGEQEDAEQRDRGHAVIGRGRLGAENNLPL